MLLDAQLVGTGVAAQVASKMPSLRALVLISPFTTLKDAVRGLVGRVAACLLGERFNTVGLLSKISAPLLCIHSNTDSVIPITHSYNLIKVHSEKQPLVARSFVQLPGGHNEMSSLSIADAITQFVVITSAIAH